MSKQKCPICQNSNADLISRGKTYSECWSCPDCGKFILQRKLQNKLSSGIAQDEKRARKYAAVMLERNLKKQNDNVRLEFDPAKGLYFYDTGTALDDFYPSSFYEKLERGFFNIVRACRFSPFIGFSRSKLKYNIRKLLFMDESLSNPEIELEEYLCEEGWIRKIGTTGTGERKYRITTKGMQHFESASEKGNSSFAFLAMWFGVPGHERFRDAVGRAVANAGYQLHVVDEQHYNGFIMDKVVNLINDSAFVIADISAREESYNGRDVYGGVRGGVYWEAGYAKGQKKQVILTCDNSEETIKRIHFDLQQYNQIRWKDVGDKILTVDGRLFEEILTERIVATVGRGAWRRQ